MSGSGGCAVLPEPSPEATAFSERLCAAIRAEIGGAGGAIPFARYMELALYAPGLGYYSAGCRKFGAGGDFVTAPEISPLFARCLARPVARAMRAVEHPQIMEVGAGSGALACELLRELDARGALPDRYLVLEVSAELRRRQRATCARRIPHLLDRIRWLDRLPEAQIAGVVLANEVLDAMPVHRVVLEDGRLQELYVVVKDGRFAERRGALSDEGLRARCAAVMAQGGAEAYGAGYVFEVNLAASGWVCSVAERLERGMILVADYGYPRREYYHPQRCGGTLMCHYRHRGHPDPLILVGLQDITAHVDFSALAEAGAAAGMAIAGFTTQAHFLLANGILDPSGDTAADGGAAQLARAQQIRRLTLPGAMGEAFKVLALTRGYELAAEEFGLTDQRARL